MPEPLCWDVEFYLASVGAPWDWDGPTTAQVRVVIPSVGVPMTMPDAAAEAQPRRVYIRRHIELMKYGYTAGCAGCIAAVGGLDSRGHTDECRRRIEAAMEADTADEGRVRVTIAHERLNPLQPAVQPMPAAAAASATEQGGKRARSSAAASAAPEDRRSSPAAMDTTIPPPAGAKRKPSAELIQGYPDEGALASTVTSLAGGAHTVV